MDAGMFRDAYKGCLIVVVLGLVAAFGLGYSCAHFPWRLHTSIERKAKS